MTRGRQTAGRVGRFLVSSGLSLALRYLLGAAILLSAVPKLIDIDANSVYVVYSYYILPIQPINFARFSGLIVPYLELLIGLGLIFGLLTRLSAIGWIALSLVYFSIKIDLIFVQNRIVPCGCFQGLIPNMLVTQSIWLDVVSTVLCVQILLASKGRQLLSLWYALPDGWRKSRLRYIR
jgi:uncharacterized membrane protein YphA (DoxX/SURF4 family)